MNAERLLELYGRVAEAPDAIAHLRSLILELAVRGALSEQNSNDEPVETLLSRSDERKFGRIESGTIKQNSVLPVVGQEEYPHIIPQTWQWVYFGNLVEFSAGRTPSRNNPSFWGDGEYPWISISDIDDGKVIETTKETITEKARTNVFKSEPVLPGTMIMSFKLTIGKVALLGVPAFHNEAIISIYPHLPELMPYLFKVLPSFARSGKTKGAIKGATLNRKSISEILIPVPPLAEQNRIVAKVDELMGLLDRLEEARAEREATRDRLTAASLARLTAPETDAEALPDYARFALDALPALTARPDQIKQLRQTILDLAVRGKLVNQDPDDEPAAELLRTVTEVKKQLELNDTVSPVSEKEEPFNLPRGWAWTRVGDLCSKTGSGSTPRGGKAAYKSSGIPFLRSQNVYDDGLRLDDVAFIDDETHMRMKGTIVKSKDLLLNITGGSMGRCARVPTDFNSANISQHVAIVRPAIQGVDAFLHTVILSPYFQKFVFDEQTGAGRGGLPKNRMDKIIVAIPPLAEQQRIVAKVDELMTLCDQLEVSLTNADATRQRLLEALLHEALEPVQTEEAAA